MYNQLSRQNVQSFLPITCSVVKWSDRLKKIYRPLFPNYLFVKIQSTSEKEVIYNTPGFVRFISTNGKPDFVSDKEIEIVKKLLLGKVRVSNDEFEIGEEVEVINGHFKGIRGILHKKNGPFRLVVSLSTIRQSLIMDISPSDVICINKIDLCS